MLDKAFLIYSALRYWYNDLQFCFWWCSTSLEQQLENVLRNVDRWKYAISCNWIIICVSLSQTNDVLHHPQQVQIIIWLMGFLLIYLSQVVESRDMGAGRYWEGGKERVEFLCLGRPSNWFYYKVTPCLPPATTALNDREMGGSHS